MMNIFKLALMVLGGLALAFIALGVVAVMSSDKKAPLPGAAQAGAAPVPAAAEAVYVTSLRQLIEDYEANEVATDHRIAGRPVRLDGVIHAIEKDMFGAPVLALRTNNEFLPAPMTLNRSEANAAAAFQRGQRVVVTCEGMKFLVGRPSGDDCRAALMK